MLTRPLHFETNKRLIHKNQERTMKSFRLGSREVIAKDESQVVCNQVVSTLETVQQRPTNNSGHNMNILKTLSLLGAMGALMGSLNAQTTNSIGVNFVGA